MTRKKRIVHQAADAAGTHVVDIESNDTPSKPKATLRLQLPSVDYTFNVTLDTLHGDPKDGNTILGALNQCVTAITELNNHIVAKLVRGEPITQLPEGMTMHLHKAQGIEVPADMGAALQRLGLVPHYGG